MRLSGADGTRAEHGGSASATQRRHERVDNRPRANANTSGFPRRTLVYLEGDAKLSTYTDAESKKQTRLDLVERTLDVLSLPQAEIEARRAAKAGGGAYSGSEQDQAIASA